MIVAAVQSGELDEAILDRTVKRILTINTPLGDMNDSFIGRQLFNMMKKQMAKMLEGQEESPTAKFMQAMAQEAPLRTMLMMSDGAVTRPMLEALLDLMNGRTFSGGKALVKAIRNK